MLFGMLAIPSLALGMVPKNLTKVKIQLIEYHNSGNYHHDFAIVIKEALYYLKFRISQNKRAMHPKNSLSSWQSMKQHCQITQIGCTWDLAVLLKRLEHYKLTVPAKLTDGGISRLGAAIYGAK